MPNEITIGMFIKKKRKEKGYTLEQVGNYVGVSKATVSRWESNEIGNMRTDKVKSLCECLDITTKEFLERSTINKDIKETKQITRKEFAIEVLSLLSKLADITDQERAFLEHSVELIKSRKV